MDFPNRNRCYELFAVFNDAPEYGSRLDLKSESIPDVCYLLSSFLLNLPEPLLHHSLFGPFFRWCVRPSCKEDEKREVVAKSEDAWANHRGEAKMRGLSSRTGQMKCAKEAEKEKEELEKKQIAIAVLILKLLPPCQFSLLVYLLGFFTELPICPDNGMTLEESAKKFAERIVGGNSKSQSRKSMLWLLTRWPRISDGLFSESRAAHEEMVKKSRHNGPVSPHQSPSMLEPQPGFYRSTTISSMQSYESSASDSLSSVCEPSHCGLYRSLSSGSIASYNPRDDPAPSSERQHPAFAQTPSLTCPETGESMSFG